MNTHDYWQLQRQENLPEKGLMYSNKKNQWKINFLILVKNYETDNTVDTCLIMFLKKVQFKVMGLRPYHINMILKHIYNLKKKLWESYKWNLTVYIC